jgi:hypothetical protein
MAAVLGFDEKTDPRKTTRRWKAYLHGTVDDATGHGVDLLDARVRSAGTRAGGQLEIRMANGARVRGTPMDGAMKLSELGVR